MDLREIVTISAIVLVASGTFTGLFFAGMPAIAVFFGLIGVPAMFIGYTWYRVRDTENSMAALGEIQGSKLERLLGALKHLWNTLVRLQERYFWPLEEAKPTVRSFTSEVPPYAEVRIENEQLFYEIDPNAAPSATWTEERERELDDLETELAERFATHLEEWTANIEEEIERLEGTAAMDAWTVSRPTRPETPVSLDEVESRYESYLEDVETKLQSWHEETAETLRSVEETQGIDVESIWDDHGMVDDALDRRDLPFAAALLRKVLEEMDAHLAGEFADEKSSLEDAVSRVRDLQLGDIVGHETWRGIEDLHQRIRELQSSAQLLEISDLETRLRSSMREVQEALLDDLEQATSTLTGRSLPDELLDERDHGTLVEELPDLHGDLHRVIPAWTSTMDQLARITRRRSKLSEAVKLYPRVESDIEENLDADGVVTATDLKVKDADPFFRIYAAKHPDECILDEDNGVLEAAGDGVSR